MSVLSALTLASTASAGPDPYLCSMSTARGTIPASFAAQACFDGKTLTIHNDLAIPMSVEVRGAVGHPMRTETDYGIAAEATRAVSTDPNMLLPGDTLKFPIGSGAAELRLTAGRYADFYTLADTVATFLPVGASVQAATGLVKELNEDFAKYHECEDKAGHNLIRKAGCHVVLARNVGFAVARGAVNGVAKGAAAVLLSTTTFDKWFSASVGNLKALIHSGTIRFAGDPRAATPSAQSVSLASLCSSEGVKLQAVNGCPYNGTTDVGATSFAYTVLIEDSDESVSPRYWNLIDFPASTCSSVHITFGLPSSGWQPGDTASIEVVGDVASPVSASAPYGSVATLSAPIGGEPWMLENSANEQ